MSEFNIENHNQRKVVCTRIVSEPWGGSDLSAAVLDVGKTYTVVAVEVHSWHTRVTLAEFPGKQFNSVQFGEIDE